MAKWERAFAEKIQNASPRALSYPAGLRLEFATDSMRPDLDGMATSVLDALQLADYLKNDNVNHLQNLTIHWLEKNKRPYTGVYNESI